MNPLTLTEVEGVQVEMLNILKDSCNISTLTTTTGSAGGQKKTYTEGEPVKCLVSQLSGRELVYAEKLNGEQGYSILVPHDTVVTIKDKVVVDVRNFEIIAVKTYPDFPAFIKLICMEII